MALLTEKLTYCHYTHWQYPYCCLILTYKYRDPLEGLGCACYLTCCDTRGTVIQRLNQFGYCHRRSIQPGLSLYYGTPSITASKIASAPQALQRISVLIRQNKTTIRVLSMSIMTIRKFFCEQSHHILILPWYRDPSDETQIVKSPDPGVIMWCFSLVELYVY
jgi:hypothetical protein